VVPRIDIPDNDGATFATDAVGIAPRQRSESYRDEI
jgi:hypothetical protein